MESLDSYNLPLNRNVDIISYNDHGLISLNKKEGILSHPNNKIISKKSLLEAEYDFKEECYFWNDNNGVLKKAWLVNRLDSPTSGVILLSLNSKIKKIARKCFKEQNVEKIYYALVKGFPKRKKGKWEGLIKPKIKTSQKEFKAVTSYELNKVSEDGIKSIIKLMPITGKTHQIRIHLSQNRLPIIGDKTYGDFRFNRFIKKNMNINRLMLHCESTRLIYDLEGKEYEFYSKAELPKEFFLL